MKKLLSLLTLLIVAIGTSWAQSDPTLSVTSSADMFKNYTEQKITLSSTFTPENETSYGGYTVKVGSSGNNNGQNYIEILSAGGDIEKITFSVTAGSNGQTITPAILGWTSTEDVTETGKADYVNATQSAGGSGKKKDISYVEDITYDVSSEGLKRVRFYRQVKNIVVGTAAKATYGNAQTPWVWGIKVWLKATGPKITTQPQGASYVTGDEIAALTVEATPDDATFQWYSCDDANRTNPDPIENAKSASYTPTGAGFYYVAVTAAGTTVNSDVAQITVSEASAPTINVSGAPAEVVKVGTEVTLTATATGVPTPTITWYNGSDEAVATVEGTELAYTVPTNTAGTYTFYAKASNGVGDDATSAVQTVVVKEQVATPTFTPNGAYFEESQSVTIACAGADAIVYSTDNGESWTAYTEALDITETTTILAKATKQDYIDSENASATFTKVTLDPQADVTAATTWDWADVTNTSSVELDKGSKALNNVDVTFANIPAYGYTAVTGLAAQDALLMNGQRAYNNANNSKHCQVNYLKFNTTVAGTVTVEYANTGGNAARTVNVNGTKGTDSSEANNSYKSETFAVGAGSVLIKGVQVSDDADKMLRIRKVVFTPFAAQDITVGKTGFATVGLPFATTVPEGVTAYAVELVTGSKVKMSAAIEEGTTIPANKGFVIVAAPNTYTFTEVATAEYEGTDLLEAVGATAKAATPDAPIYVLTITDATNKKIGFKKATSGSLGAYKAYLPGTVSTLTSLSASFDDDPTAVDAIAEANEADAEAPVKVIKNGKLFIGNYNVAGQQVK